MKKELYIVDELIKNHDYEIEIFFDKLPFAFFSWVLEIDMFVWQILVDAIMSNCQQISDKKIEDISDLAEWLQKFLKESDKDRFEEQLHELLPRFSFIMLKDKVKRRRVKK